MPAKLHYNFIKHHIENFGYKLLSDEYKNTNSKLKFLCPENHIFEMRYHDFQGGHRCPKCFNEIRSLILKNDKEYIKNYIEGFGYKLLSTEYINNLTKLQIQCSKNHIFEMSYNHFQQGHRCPECQGKKRYTIKRIKEYIENFEYKLLSDEYINNLVKIKFQCPEGHIYDVRFNDFQQGHRCPECSSVLKWSKPEKEIVEYVKSIYSGDVVENDRTQVKNYWTGFNLELDVWLPDVRKAIEFNGEYWHSSDKAKWYDEIKKKQCVQKKIDLLIIQENDWYNDKLCCLNMIKYNLCFS